MCHERDCVRGRGQLLPECWATFGVGVRLASHVTPTPAQPTNQTETSAVEWLALNVTQDLVRGRRLIDRCGNTAWFIRGPILNCRSATTAIVCYQRGRMRAQLIWICKLDRGAFAGAGHSTGRLMTERGGGCPDHRNFTQHRQLWKQSNKIYYTFHVIQFKSISSKALSLAGLRLTLVDVR